MAKKTDPKSSKTRPKSTNRLSTTATPAVEHALPGDAVGVDALTPDPRNARLHNDRNLKSIADSLKRYGQVKPIVVDADGLVLAGNGTLAAAKSLGWTHVGVVRTHLRGAEARAYAIADNRTAELAEWDLDELNATLSELEADGFDAIADLALTDAELSAMADGDFAAAHAFAPKREKPERPPGVETVEPQFKVIVDCDGEKQQAEIIKYLEGIGAKYKAPSV